MMDRLKKLWYWGVLIGLIILGIALCSSTFRSGKLKELLKKRPKEKKYKDPKLPKKPEYIDYVKLYRRKIENLK